MKKSILTRTSLALLVLIGAMTPTQAEEDQAQQFTPEFRQVHTSVDPKHTPKITAPDSVKRGAWFNVTVTVGAGSQHPSLQEHFVRGGPGIYRGDTYFYSQDLDLRGRGHEIDTTACPVYLLTGEYDHACTPADTADAIAEIPGAKGGPMKDIGHFPMAENYPLFKTYLLPILVELHPMETNGREVDSRALEGTRNA